LLLWISACAGMTNKNQIELNQAMLRAANSTRGV
jgi:hypothetical protein